MLERVLGMVACRALKIFNLIIIFFFFLQRVRGMCPRKAATAGRIGTWYLVVSTLCTVARAGDYE